MRTRTYRSAVAAVLGTLLLGLGAAQASAALPPIHHSGPVQYLSGGVGQDEAQAIESASKQWPLTLEFAIKDKAHSDFAAAVDVHVRDAKGHTVLKTTSSGPFLLAKLPAGHYGVDASLRGKTLHENLVVSTGQPTRHVFLWPQGTDEGRS